MHSYTLFPEVDKVLRTLLSNVQMVLQTQFIGMYLYGSLATGDFNLETSDIDFLVVTSDELPMEVLDQLAEMHLALMETGGKWALKLEGAYMPLRAVRQAGIDDGQYMFVNEGKFYLSGEGADWVIQRHVIRECGVVLAGPQPDSLINPVTADAIRDAIRAIMDAWWLPLVTGPDERLNRSDYQAFAIVSMCRVLYTMQHGTIASKPVSARWAQAQLGSSWHGLIETALMWRPPTELDLLDQTVAFVRFTASQAI